MAKPKGPTVYVVVAVHWQYDGGLNKVNVRGEGDPCQPVRVFRDRSAADAYAAKREAAKRRPEYPFSYLMTRPPWFWPSASSPSAAKRRRRRRSRSCSRS
jgi:hypothetical protein